MIVFDLKCVGGHVFEAWFGSGNAYEDQRAAALIACPICQDTRIDKAVMAPAIGAKGNQKQALPRRGDQQAGHQSTVSGGKAAAMGAALAAALPEEARAQLSEAIARVAEAQAAAISQSSWVGDKFAEKARAMHYGEQDHAPIHGTTSMDEAKAMLEEGVAVAPLLIPVTPPDQVN